MPVKENENYDAATLTCTDYQLQRPQHPRQLPQQQSCWQQQYLLCRENVRG
jgi:hypothetical protein